MGCWWSICRKHFDFICSQLLLAFGGSPTHSLLPLRGMTKCYFAKVLKRDKSKETRVNLAQRRIMNPMHITMDIVLFSTSYCLPHCIVFYILKQCFQCRPSFPDPRILRITYSAKTTKLLLELMISNASFDYAPKVPNKRPPSGSLLTTFLKQ